MSPPVAVPEPREPDTLVAGNRPERTVGATLSEPTGLSLGRGRTGPYQGRWRVFAGFWLVYLAYPLGSALHREHGRPAMIALRDRKSVV